MHTSLVALLAALLIPAADGPPEAASNPIVTFLRAADVNDFATMEAVMDRGSANFLKLVSNCYLRRVYSNEQAGETVAAWMCAEGPNRSRVVLANLALTSANKVSVSVQMNNTNNRPAPERTGSAFAE